LNPGSWPRTARPERSAAASASPTRPEPAPRPRAAQALSVHEGITKYTSASPEPYRERRSGCWGS
jgi:hypothetical protein